MPKQQETTRSLAKTLGSKLREHVPLRDLGALSVGGVADFYTAAATIQELTHAVQAARAAEVEWLVFGSGTQTVISDFGFPGLLIHNQTANLQYVPSRGQVLVDSGLRWPKLILGAVGYDLGGLEGLLVVPGTIGASLVQDRTAPNGQAVRSVVREVTLLDETGVIRHLSVQEFYALPRASRGVVLVVVLQLVHSRHDEVIRRVGIYERQRRHWETVGTRWLGPVFASETNHADPAALSEALGRTKILGMACGGAVFSRIRPNYIEARGRLTAHDIRELVSNAQHILSEELIEPPLVQLRFVGTWQDNQLELSDQG